MKFKKKLIFLPIILAASMLFGACNNAATPDTPTPPGPVETTYTVSFTSNGGSGYMDEVTGVSGEYTLPACGFTAPSGKYFAGWKVNGEGDLLQPGAKITVSADTRIVAQWNVTKYTVTFDANGGTGTMAAVNDQLGEYTLPENAFTAPAGKHFAGWKVNGEGSLLQPGAKIEISANTSLVAQWALTTYTVSFDANGGTGTMNAIPEQLGEYTLPDCTFTAPAGKHFIGWKVNGEGDLVQPGAKINVGANVKLVAQWAVTKYTISFSAGEGTGTKEAVGDQLGEYALPENPFTAPAGKHFVGWRVNGEGDLLKPGAKINVSANIQLVAQWATTTYTVSFAAGEGSGEMAAVGEQVGEYTLPANAFTAPAGKHFAGWKVNGEGELLQPGAKINVGANVQLVAQYAITTYTITYSAGDGTGEMAPATEVVGEYELPANGFTAPTGKHFAGWVLSTGAVKQPGETITVSADLTVSAKWEFNQYTVTFKNGDDVLETHLVTHGQKAVFEGADPTKAADANAYKYEFRGWDKDIDAAITEATVFNAQFAAYEEEYVVDNFESYADTETMKEGDTGWVALGYHQIDQDHGEWNTTTNAAVSLGSKAAQGDKALRFDSWTNKVTYKFKKAFTANQFEKSVNAIKFSMLTPAGNDITVLLYASIPVTRKDTGNTEIMEVPFYYHLKSVSGEYVEYTIPLADEEWKAWNNDPDPETPTVKKNIKVLAESQGMCEDDVMKYATKIEFTVAGDRANGAPCISFFDNLRFDTLDNPQLATIETLGQYTKYTALANNGKTIKIDIKQNSAATATVIDMETPLEIDGHYEIEGNQITFTSDDSGATLVYTGKFTNGGQRITAVSSNGALKDAVTGVAFNAVQVVENFEEYTEEGTLWYQTNKDHPEQRSGARGAYYAEYYSGSGSAVFGGSGWSLMGGSGDQVRFKTDGGHTGNKYMAFKNSSGNGMRYMQFGLIDGTSEKNAFRGTKLSFWVNTNNRVPEFRVSMFSQTTPRNATKDSDVRVGVFTPLAQINSWTHYEVDLNPDLVYYGFMIFMEKNLTGTDAWLRIDDVEVYTASPYATYVAPLDHDLALTPKQSYIGVIGGQIRAEIEVVDSTNVVLSAPGLNMSLNGTYSITKDEITITLVDGTVYKATLSLDTKAMTFKSVTGNNAVVVGALTNLSFNKIDYLENAEQYDSAGTMYYVSNQDENSISGARGAYYCDWYDGQTTYKSQIGGDGWSLMGGSGDQLTLDDTTGADGTQSLKIKRSTGGGMRYTQWDLYKGTAAPHRGYNKFVINLKNSSATDIDVVVYVYKISKLTRSNNSDSNRVKQTFTIKAGQGWTACEIDLDANTTYYGYGMFIEKKTSVAWLNVDKVYFCNSNNVADYNFYAKKDVTLTGELNDGVAATIKFGNPGKLKITCDEFNLSEKEVSYKMIVDKSTNKQYIAFVIGENETETIIVGEFYVDMQGYAYFKITNMCSGAAAAQLKVDNILTNKPAA